jgi:hypothetical protein
MEDAVDVLLGYPLRWFAPSLAEYRYALKGKHALNGASQRASVASNDVLGRRKQNRCGQRSTKGLGLPDKAERLSHGEKMCPRRFADEHGWTLSSGFQQHGPLFVPCWVADERGWHVRPTPLFNLTILSALLERAHSRLLRLTRRPCRAVFATSTTPPLDCPTPNDDEASERRYNTPRQR